MGRFLIFFSYVGTCYRGVQIQRMAGNPITAFKTVQGVLEECLNKLRPTNDVKMKTSSRTDSNVHALCNAAHVDLVRSPVEENTEFDPLFITSQLNRNLNEKGENIRILKTVRVADDFNSRRLATGRSYVYRLAVITDLALYNGFPWTSLDLGRSHRIYPPFDVEKFLRAAEILSGSHNFLSFTTKQFDKTSNPEKTVRISVKRSSAYMEECQAGLSEAMEFWEVHFSCQSFLYKQVRRMMGSMVAVARGKMSLDKLQYLLDNPSVYHFNAIEALPGCGLYLKNVCFPEEVLRYEPERSAEDVSTSSYSISSETEELSHENMETYHDHLSLHAEVTVDQLHTDHQNTNKVSSMQVDFQGQENKDKIDPEFGDQRKTEDETKEFSLKTKYASYLITTGESRNEAV